ncbi:hypothetical protein [uncultured Kordia sp.]|uniref:hypothetical protein n=1 Tax=uncultured Kordia sp. TaxID=507699 RepID=UPI00260D26DC|nr:hypothetical protein [uncultured Kordia sp.]
MKKIQLILLLIISAFSFTSCASYSNKISKKERLKLTKNNIQKIEGVYEYQAFRTFEANRKSMYDVDNDIENLDYYILGTRLSLNPIKHTVEVKIVSKDKISFTFKRNDVFVSERTIKMKLRSNGFLHLKNKHVKVKGIPLLVGGITSDKMRIGISKNDDLLLNYAHDSFGSFIFFVASRGFNRFHFYKRINPSL